MQPLFIKKSHKEKVPCYNVAITVQTIKCDSSDSAGNAWCVVLVLNVLNEKKED